MSTAKVVSLLFVLYIRASDCYDTPKWTEIGTGDMTEDGWENIGNAASLEEAMKLMLSNSKYAVDGAILFYSGYSYAWGVYCATLEMAKDNQGGDNPNWTKYQLSYQGGCDCTLLEYEITGTGETEIDSRCLDIPNDPFGGLGCNACNRPDCRLCGFGDYPQCGGALNMP